MSNRFEVKAIGRVESPLTDLASAPRQADEGAPAAWLGTPILDVKLALSDDVSRR